MVIRSVFKNAPQRLCMLRSGAILKNTNVKLDKQSKNHCPAEFDPPLWSIHFVISFALLPRSVAGDSFPLRLAKD
jgi:hypothetical protein